MDIKKAILFILIISLMFISFIMCLNFVSTSNRDLSHDTKDNININSESFDSLKVSDLELPDKVYTFLAGADTQNFDLYLEKHYTYFIYIELVTPHNVTTMRIRIWDPDDEVFKIFESEMFYNPEYGRYFQIPFGIVMSGDYLFEFYANAPTNFNLHILIEQGPECLYDKIDPQETDSIILYKVNRFSNGDFIDHDVDLETDMMYKFYIGRVSAIAITQNNDVWITYKIEDPDGNEFDIYNNELIADIDGLNSFSFGTAIEGEYIIKLTVYCNVPNVNIAYAIVEDYEIGDVIDANETKPVESTSFIAEAEEKLDDASANLPSEMVVGTLIVVCGIGGVALTALMVHQKRSGFDVNIRNLKNK